MGEKTELFDHRWWWLFSHALPRGHLQEVSQMSVLNSSYSKPSQSLWMKSNQGVVDTREQTCLSEGHEQHRQMDQKESY